MSDKSPTSNNNEPPRSKRPARNSIVRTSENTSPPRGHDGTVTAVVGGGGGGGGGGAVGRVSNTVALDVKPSFDSEEMKRIEDEFQKTLRQLLSAPNLAQFKQEYEKLHRNMRKMYENEVKMMDKCRELHSDILSNAARIATATRLAQEDSITIKNLKREIEKAWRLLDESHAKEDRAGETIVILKIEIHNLTQLIEKNAGFASGQEAGVRELIKARDQLNNEVDRQRQENTALQERIVRGGEREDGCRRRILALENVKTEQEERINFLSSERDSEKKRRAKLEVDLQQRDEDAAAKDLDAKRIGKELDHEREEVARYQAFQVDLRRRLDIEHKEREQFVHGFEKLKKEFDERLTFIDTLQTDIKGRMSEAKLRDEEMLQLKIRLSKQAVTAEAAGRKVRSLEEQRRDLEAERVALHDQTHAQAKEIDGFRHFSQAEQRRIGDLVRVQENLEKQVARINQKNTLLHRQVDHVMANEATQKLEMMKFEKEKVKARRIITVLESDAERHKHITNGMRINLKKLDEDVEEKNREVDELKRVAREKERENHALQTKTEEMRSERNVCLKKLMDSSDEADKAKRKLRTISSQLEQAKEDMAVKDEALAREHLERQRVEREKNKLAAETSGVRQQNIEIRKQLDHQQVEADNLCRIIRQADGDIMKKAKLIDRLMAERDILGTQLINRNDELALLGEKMRIFDTMIQRADGEYQRRISDVRILRLEIKRLRRLNGRYEANALDLRQLRNELINLHRDLARERQKSKILEDELRLPKNGHRWRQLQGTDPSKYELLQKLHHYQRKLIHKTELLVKKDELLNEKERLYLVLKERMAKLPGAEVFVEINRLGKMLTHRNKELRCASADLNMYEKMYYDERDASKKLEEELIGFKNRYYLLRVRLDKYRQANQQFNGISVVRKRRKKQQRIIEDDPAMLTAQAYKKLSSSAQRGQKNNDEGDVRPAFVGGGFRINTVSLFRPMKTSTALILQQQYQQGDDKTTNGNISSRIIHERRRSSATAREQQRKFEQNNNPTTTTATKTDSGSINNENHKIESKPDRSHHLAAVASPAPPAGTQTAATLRGEASILPPPVNVSKRKSKITDEA